MVVRRQRVNSNWKRKKFYLFLNLLFYILKFQGASHQPILLAHFSWRVYHFKCLISWGRKGERCDCSPGSPSLLGARLETVQLYTYNSNFLMNLQSQLSTPKMETGNHSERCFLWNYCRHTPGGNFCRENIKSETDTFTIGGVTCMEGKLWFYRPFISSGPSIERKHAFLELARW